MYIVKGQNKRPARFLSGEQDGGNTHKNKIASPQKTKISDALSWAKRTSISDMGHNFAVNAKAQINNALSSNTYATATRNALPKAQRNCAVVIYKFLVDVGAVK